MQVGGSALGLDRELLSQTVEDALVVLDQLAEASLELLVLAPGLDVMVDGLAHRLRDGHAIGTSDRLKLGGLLLGEAHREGFCHRPISQGEIVCPESLDIKVIDVKQLDTKQP